MPHAWIDGAGGRSSTLDLVASRWTLLVGLAGEPWLDAAADIGLAAHRVDVPLPGLADHGAPLVRPDAVVAARATTPPPHPARYLTGLLDQLLDRSRGRRRSRGWGRAGRCAAPDR